MDLFSSFFKNKIDDKLWIDKYSENEKVGKGLMIGKEKDEGYWEIVHVKSNTMLLRTDSKNKALHHADVLLRLTDWSKFVSISEDFMKKEPATFEEFRQYVNQHGMSPTFNGLYLSTKDANNTITYKIKTSAGDIRVLGKFVAFGLGVHEEMDGTAKIDHIPTGYMVSHLSTFQKALDVAHAMKPLLDWRDEKIKEKIAGNPPLKSYLVRLKEAAEREEELPPIPKELSMELLMENNPSIRSRKEVYDEAMKELYDMYGMDEIKEKVERMMSNMVVDQRLKETGIKEEAPTLHTVFYGPPGTGKTQVARILAKLFYAMGYLEKDTVVETIADDLIGQYVGETAKLTQAKIDEAMGGILFIDEAYGFASGSMQGNKGNFGQDAVRVLLTAAENNRHRFCIILAGYENDMNQMMKLNEGIESRFPERNRFRFKDYTPKELTFIASKMIRERNFIVSPEVEAEIERCIMMLSKNGALNGNARWARNFKEAVVDEHKEYLKHATPEDLRVITKETVQIAAGIKKRPRNTEGLEEVKQQALQRIYGMVGLSSLKQNLEELMDYLDIEKMKFDQGVSMSKPTMHMIFTGPPGTGKTTVAEHVGQFLKGAGMLSNGHFIQIAATDLTKGNSAEAVESIINKAYGGVLFIDEAYSLCNDPQGKKAVDLLIQEMENKRDDLVVILAGYEDEMKQLLHLNPGFESRIVYTFDFPYYTADEVMQIIHIELKKNGLSLITEAEKCLIDGVKSIEEREGKIEGNGRWARNFVQRLKMKQSSRVKRTHSTDFMHIVREDIENTFQVVK